ncbi:hypothetical protein [Streptomyces qinglanensis]|uniref:hypothetical protein n=1 Tax=Streptomyces qinglanensis TaxID=943816 RepID=UPI00378BAD35
MNEYLHPLVREILEDGEDDWVMADNVIAYATEYSNSSGRNPKEVAGEFLYAILENGLMEVGDLEEPGFVPWSHSLDETFEKCIQGFVAYDWEPLGALWWLRITEHGRRWLREHS